VISSWPRATDRNKVCTLADVGGIVGTVLLVLGVMFLVGGIAVGVVSVSEHRARP
jgi:hypothetical protein